jgi:hypothetical protein
VCSIREALPAAEVLVFEVDDLAGYGLVYDLLFGGGLIVEELLELDDDELAVYFLDG